MKRVTIQAPFTDGLVTDVPAHLLGPRMASQAENMLILDNVARRRRGWEFASTAAANGLENITGVKSLRFALAAGSRIIFTTSAGAYDEVNSTKVVQTHVGVGTPWSFPLNRLIPRCVYRDELILCDPSGNYGIVRYAGAAWHTGTGSPTGAREADYNNVGTFVDSSPDTSTLTYTDGSAFAWTVGQITNNAQSGWYANMSNASIPSMKVISGTSTTVTVDGVTFDGAFSKSSSYLRSFGGAYPAVAVYEAGSVTYDSGTNTVTGVGTKWVDVAYPTISYGPVLHSSWPSREAIMFVRDSTGNAFVSMSPLLTSNTSFMLGTGSPAPASITTPTNHFLLRGLPFADACVHRNSLVGTGCAQYPNRVYICPPGWNMETPPGLSLPLECDSAATYTNADPNVFLVDFVDVPTSIDSDPCVAVMSSPGPVLVLKTDACYGIYGDYPNFTQSLIAQGAGCVDLRSAVDSRWGQFWAGKDGVFRYANGAVSDITGGRINTTWRNLVNTFHGTSGFYCAMGQSADKLLVSIGNSAGGECLSYDLASERWDGFLSNHKAVFFDAPSDTSETLLWAAGADMATRTRLRDSGPMVEGSGPVNDGALLTTDAAPVMTATTGTGMAQHQGIDGLTKMIDLAVSAEVEGPATGHAKLTPSAEIAGGIDDENENSTTALPAIEPTASVSLIQRTRGRINRKGRTFGVKVDTTSTPTGNAQNADYDVKLHQITASFRESRERA